MIPTMNFWSSFALVSSWNINAKRSKSSSPSAIAKAMIHSATWSSSVDMMRALNFKIGDRLSLLAWKCVQKRKYLCVAFVWYLFMVHHRMMN